MSLIDRIDQALEGGYRLWSEVEPLLREAREELTNAQQGRNDETATIRDTDRVQAEPTGAPVQYAPEDFFPASWIVTYRFSGAAPVPGDRADRPADHAESRAIWRRWEMSRRGWWSKASIWFAGHLGEFFFIVFFILVMLIVFR